MSLSIGISTTTAATTELSTATKLRSPIMRETKTVPKEWSNLAKVVYKRTYSRVNDGISEEWEDTVKRVIEGNVAAYRGTELLEPNEEERLYYYMYNRKAMPAGRGLWFSGTDAQKRLGGVGLNNCYFLTCDTYTIFPIAQDYLMLGGGVGMSVEHKFVSKFPKVKKDVSIVHKNTKDADFIVPDSREGWCRLTKRILKSYFETGESFSFSTICIRGAGEPIETFGGKASGPVPLIAFVEKVCSILSARAGKHIRPIDALDIICSIGELIVSGNVRRSALLVQGDAWDKEFLRAKRWDLGNIPTQRSMANLSVVCDDVDDLHPLFWETYKNGEPFGIINLKNMRKYGRMGEVSPDDCQGVNPCAEATLSPYEACNLQELFLPNLESEAEFTEAARLMFRWGKRVSNENYHVPETDKIVKKNRRIGTGITGCLQSDLFTEDVLDRVYNAIQEENKTYSALMGVPESIRTTTVKPSGTLSLLGDTTPGIHPAYSQYYIRRMSFSANDDLIPLLRKAGHHIEPVRKFDKSKDIGTLVVSFPCKASDGTPIADESWDTWKQLEVLKKAQKHWADMSVSVTVYYKKEELSKLKSWLTDNISSIKTISFLCHDDHGFVQAPYEAISEEDYIKYSKSLTPINFEDISQGEIESVECQNGVCPIK